MHIVCSHESFFFIDEHQWYGQYNMSRRSLVGRCIYYIMASVMASSTPDGL